MGGTLAPGYLIRSPHADEAAAIQALIVATDVAEFGESQGYTLDDLLGDWRELELGSDAWVAIGPEGGLAGYGYLRQRGHVRMDAEVYVHPAHTGRGIGTALACLAEARAREHVPLAPPGARVVVHNWINARNAEARGVLEREGYAPVRYFYRMETDLAEPPPADWPPGMTVRPFVADEDERRFYETVEEAMGDHWGHVPVAFEEWTRRHLGPSFDPSLWFLALDGGEPAGAALLSLSEGIGWVDTLAVRRPWRRRGLGLALLRHAFAEFHRRDAGRAALGVDAASPTGATRLYERAWMRVAQEYAAYSKELRPGEEPAERGDEG